MRVHNFGAGPAAIPESVLKQAQSDMLDWQGQGMSVMEIPHRGEAYLALKASLEADIREVLQVPDNYHVLILGFPARFQFAMVPMSFLKTKAFYWQTGYWSNMAYQDALLQGAAESSETLPKQFTDYNYFYFAPNETLTSVSVDRPQEVDIPVIADATSSLFAREFNIRDYDLLFAGLQKNLGPAGLSLVIISDELLKSQKTVSVKLCDYQLQVQHRGMMATPPVYNMYMASLVVKWLMANGGVSELEKENKLKAKRLYEYIDSSKYYVNHIPSDRRSIHNVTFELSDNHKQAAFIKAAEKEGLVGLKGHRAVGGIRASLYNAVAVEAVDALIEHMKQFAGENLPPPC